jgi:hypothetical protein
VLKSFLEITLFSFDGRGYKLVLKVKKLFYL